MSGSPSSHQLEFILYSDLSNNCASNLILFLGKKHLHNLIRTYTFIYFEVIFYLHVYSDLHDYSILRKFPTCTFIFMSMIQMFDLKQTQFLFITFNISQAHWNDTIFALSCVGLCNFWTSQYYCFYFLHNYLDLHDY